MSAKIENFKEEDGILNFTLTNVDVSYANAVRRTILSDIPIVVFKTSPYEENKSNIIENTTRLNNEIIKQRLSCIPICIQDLTIPIEDYMLEIDVENKTDTIIYITTKDFKILNTKTNKYLDESDLRKIFPPYIPPTGKGEYYIDFVRLRPKISDEILGEKLKLTCKFSISTSREDSMFNAIATCSYGFTPNEEKITEELEIRKQKWKDEDKTAEEIKFLAKNWKLLEGLRYVKTYSFDFIIQSIGIYENTDIIIKSCDILIDRFNKQKNLLSRDELEIKPADSTLENSYDIILANEDYTIGNIINYELYSVFYKDYNLLSYVGFKKMHPHDDDSIVRIAFVKNTSGKSNVIQMLDAVIDSAIKQIESIKGCFDGSRK
jgi:DNA-directed RNA polymerase subunit L